MSICQITLLKLFDLLYILDIEQLPDLFPLYLNNKKPVLSQNLQ